MFKDTFNSPTVFIDSNSSSRGMEHKAYGNTKFLWYVGEGGFGFWYLWSFGHSPTFSMQPRPDRLRVIVSQLVVRSSKMTYYGFEI